MKNIKQMATSSNMLFADSPRKACGLSQNSKDVRQHRLLFI